MICFRFRVHVNVTQKNKKKHMMFSWSRMCVNPVHKKIKMLEYFLDKEICFCVHKKNIYYVGFIENKYVFICTKRKTIMLDFLKWNMCSYGKKIRSIVLEFFVKEICICIYTCVIISCKTNMYFHVQKE